MTLEEIKAAVNAGKTVCWKHEGYVICQDQIGQWFIKYLPNNNAVGLTWQDMVTLNGRPQDFFVKEIST